MIDARHLAGLITTLALGAWGQAHADAVTEWNAVTLKCVQGAPGIPANRLGPPGLMDIAVVQAAVHDAVQAIQGRFEPYQYDNAAMRGVGSPQAAAAAAAHGVLVGLYGADDPCLATAANPAATYPGDAGLQVGAQAAAAVLPLYRPTMVLPTDPFVGSTEIGQWRPTPGVTQAANTFMAVTAPFALKEPEQFRPQPPMPLTSERYARDYEEVKALGSVSSTARTPEQTDLARFWSVNFFSQWYEAVRGIAETHVSEIGDRARLLALVSFVAADSQIAVYETKAHYNFWRPITAIREGDHDGNDDTIGDAAWTAFAATPPYSEHSSGANCLTGAITTALRLFLGTDDVAFTIRSTAANLSVNPRTYQRLSQAAQEVVDVRIYQGIHFRYADEVGREQGERIAHWAFSKVLRPVPGSR